MTVEPFLSIRTSERRSNPAGLSSKHVFWFLLLAIQGAVLFCIMVPKDDDLPRLQIALKDVIEWVGEIQRSLKSNVRSDPKPTSVTASDGALRTPSDPLADLNEMELRKLQNFNANRMNKYNDEIGRLLDCIQQIHSASANASKLGLFGFMGTTLAVVRGWQAPWDHDMDLAYDVNIEIVDALIAIWEPLLVPYGTPKNKVYRSAQQDKYSKCKPLGTLNPQTFKRNLSNIWNYRYPAKLYPKEGTIIRINLRNTGLNVDFWPLFRKGDEWLCGWICVNRRDIFPLRSGSIKFFQESGDPFEITVPTMANVGAFMTAYKPYHTWREVPFNVYVKNKDGLGGSWNFSHEVRRKYLMGLGPQIMF